MDPGAPEGLVRVDVPHACHGPLVEQHRLHRRPPAREPLPEVPWLVPGLERLASDARVDIGGELAGLEQEPRAESADISIRNVRPVVQTDNCAAVGIVRQSTASRVQERPRHPEVNHQSAPRLEPDNQILAATLDRSDPLAEELGGDLRRIGRARQARVGDRDVREPPALEHRCEPAAHGLDLRQLGHAATVPSRCQSTTSSRTPRTDGASSPIVYAARMPATACSVASAVRACTCASTSPFATSAPRFAWHTMPTAWSTASLFVRRPAPSCMAALPTAIAESAVTCPACGAATSRTTGATGNAASSAVPPCASSQRRQVISAEPSWTAVSARRRPSASSTPRSESASSLPHASSTSSVKSAGPRPRTVSRASRTSRLLPTAAPSGCSMSVSRQTTSRPACCPSEIIVSESRRASSSVRMKAPFPTLTSRTIACAPPASFFD